MVDLNFGTSENFPLGSVVWAKIEGFPWWPSRIVTRGQIELDEGEEEPEVGRGRVLVEFFFDNGRFASMKEESVQHFECPEHDVFRSYNGFYKQQVRCALVEAEEYYANQLKREAVTAANFKRPSLRERSVNFPPKSLVWAKREGYPWWPGFVVARKELVPHPDGEVPMVEERIVFVQFFHDNHNAARVEEKFVKHFKCPEHDRHRSYGGIYIHGLRKAVVEADNMYSHQQQSRWAATGGMAKLLLPPCNSTHPVAGDTHVRGNQKRIVEGNLDIPFAKTREPTHKVPTRHTSTKRRRKEVFIPSLEVNLATKPVVEKGREALIKNEAELQKTLKRRKVKHGGVKRIHTISPETEGEAEKGNKGGKGDVEKHREGIRGKVTIRGVNTVDLDSVPGLDIPGEGVVTTTSKKNDNEIHSPKSTLPTSCKQEQVAIPVKREPEISTVDVKEEGHLEGEEISSEKNGDAYLSYSKEDLVVLLRKQEDYIRAMQEEDRKHCLIISHQSDVIQSSKALMEMCLPIFEVMGKCSPVIFEEIRKCMHYVDEGEELLSGESQETLE